METAHTCPVRFRNEHDAMGEIAVPDHAWYGAGTARAIENFPISGLRLPRGMIRALGLIKAAAATVNHDVGLLDPARSGAISRAAMEVADGTLDDHFPVDVFQTGSGTSSNMNANEVIARRATALLAEAGIGLEVHPNDHVNMGQSSNDAFPAAIHVSASLAIEHHLAPALGRLVSSFLAKARQFDDVVKIGRTHLQDATPIRVGQEFCGFAHLIDGAARELARASELLTELHLGGTAVGTGVSTHPEFGTRMAAALSTLTGRGFREASNHVASQSYPAAVSAVSGALRSLAGVHLKVANDIRWMGSGPRAGLGELILPAVQPGSSIMPGKVNPVMAESLMMVCVQVIGLDSAIQTAAFLGNFELNTMLPLLAYDLLLEISLMANGIEAFRVRLVDGLNVDRARVEALVEQSLALATPLAPLVGYDRAARIAQQAHVEGKTIREVARELGLLPDHALDRALDLRRLTEPGVPTIG